MTTGERQGRNFISVLGALPPSPRNLSLWGQNVWTTMKTLERRIGLRRNATPAPSPAPEWRGRPRAPPNLKKTPPPVKYFGPKKVFTKGATFDFEFFSDNTKTRRK